MLGICFRTFGNIYPALFNSVRKVSFGKQGCSIYFRSESDFFRKTYPFQAALSRRTNTNTYPVPRIGIGKFRVLTVTNTDTDPVPLCVTFRKYWEGGCSAYFFQIIPIPYRIHRSCTDRVPPSTLPTAILVSEQQSPFCVVLHRSR